MENDLSRIQELARRTLGFELQLLDPLPDPEYAFDARRRQYSSIEVMRVFAGVAPAGDTKVVGITECDLFIPVLTFVFGQAQLGGRFAMVSLARLRQEFYGLPADRDVLCDRAVKEVAHELGHTFGLAHCPSLDCAMSLSTDIGQVDAKRAGYCDSCASALRETEPRTSVSGRKR